MKHAKIGDSFIPLCKHGNIATLCTPCIIDGLHQRIESAEARAAAADARAAQAEAERDAYKERLEACGNFGLSDTPEEISATVLIWQTKERDEARQQRDEAWRELYYEQHRNDFLERRVRELTRQSLSEYEPETPLGQQLDGGGDEVE